MSKPKCVVLMFLQQQFKGLQGILSPDHRQSRTASLKLCFYYISFDLTWPALLNKDTQQTQQSSHIYCSKYEMVREIALMLLMCVAFPLPVLPQCQWVYRTFEDVEELQRGRDAGEKEESNFRPYPVENGSDHEEENGINGTGEKRKAQSV